MFFVGQTIIEISGCPISNDVIGLQDLYLQLEISDSIFETVVDEISSGLDPSASNYIVSPSYVNGNLVRSGGSTTTTSATQRTTGTTGTTSTTTATTSTTSTTSTSGTSSSSSY